MPYCFFCGKELYLVNPILSVQDCICENCKRTFSIKDNGPVSEKELNRARREFQYNFEDNVKGIEPVKQTIARMNAKSKYKSSIKLNNPDNRNIDGPAELFTE